MSTTATATTTTSTIPVLPAGAPISGPAPVYTYSPWALGDFGDRRRTFGNAYAQPFWPWSGYQPVMADARFGDYYDRRRCFGNVYAQPFFPWSGQNIDHRLGDAYDRRRTFGNYFVQPFVPSAGPVGPALGYHYADSAYRVLPPGTSMSSVSASGVKAQDNIYPFA